MATVENVNIEINQKLLDELAALKAENETLRNESTLWAEQFDSIVLKEAQMREKAYQLQADKAELLEALNNLFFGTNWQKTIKDTAALLSKHSPETK